MNPCMKEFSCNMVVLHTVFYRWIYDHVKVTRSNASWCKLYFIYTHFEASTTEGFENIVGKGEISGNKQFLLFPQCFLLNQVIVSF